MGRKTLPDMQMEVLSLLGLDELRVESLVATWTANDPPVVTVNLWPEHDAAVELAGLSDAGDRIYRCAACGHEIEEGE